MLVLKFPSTTPSGFTIGTTLIAAICLSLTASDVSEHTHLRKPYNTKLLFDSPGCCRPIIKIHFFDLFSTVASVIVANGI